MSVLLGHMTVTETAMPLAMIRMAVLPVPVEKGLMATAHFVQVQYTTCMFSVNIETLSVDIDECINATTCDANAECNNTYGSFLCTCNAGYEGNGFTCTGMDWIVMGARSIIMSMDCSCSDVDECAMDVDNCDPTNGVCTNTEGSFICTCTIGYSGDGINCSSEWHHGFHKVFWVSMQGF